MLKYQNYLLDFPERDKLNRIIDYFITSSEPDLIVPIFEEWLESRFKEYRKHVFYVDLAICKSTQTKSYIFLCENARFKEQYSSFIDEEIKANRGIAVKKRVCGRIVWKYFTERYAICVLSYISFWRKK